MRYAACPMRMRTLRAVYISALWCKQISLAQFTTMEQEREGESERLGKRQTTTLHRLVKRARLLVAQQRENRSRTGSHPTQMAAQLGHLATWEPQACACVQH